MSKMGGPHNKWAALKCPAYEHTNGSNWSGTQLWSWLTHKIWSPLGLRLRQDRVKTQRPFKSSLEICLDTKTSLECCDANFHHKVFHMIKKKYSGVTEAGNRCAVMIKGPTTTHHLRFIHKHSMEADINILLRWAWLKDHHLPTSLFFC